MNVKRRGGLFLCLLLALSLLLLLPLLGRGNRVTAVAETGTESSTDLIAIRKFDVDAYVHTDRRVEVKERVTVTFLASGLSMFYHSLPTDGCRYENITATCADNPDFYYEVADNPDMSGFIDVNCIGGAQKGNTWTYEISYTMLPEMSGAGMIIDIVGYGSTVPLRDVTARLHFPEGVQAHTVFVGQEKAEEGSYIRSEDGKTLEIHRDILPVVYNDRFDERTAQGITVDFTLEEGVLIGYGRSRIFTENSWKLALGAASVIGMSVLLLLLCRRKKELIPIVSVTPPDGMSPLQMGKLIDGSADNEDVTSMVYYFANKGYLKINLENEDDPILIALVDGLPEDAPVHEKTLFNGLFADATKEKEGRSIPVSKLVTKFYKASEIAKKQVLTPQPMYEGKSSFAYGAGCVLGVLFGFISALLMGKRLGGGYFYFAGGFFLFPVLVNVFLGVVAENYRYKWKTGKRVAFLAIEWGIALLSSLIVIFAFGRHVMTEWEKLIICIGAFLPAFLGQLALSRSEEYVETLGKIVGFKQFIVVTEEDKIKEMLASDPELYYEVLPYAQVLGVTDEWTEKFERITLQPPTWYVGNFTVFDYLILNRCMTYSMMRAMTAAAQRAQGGGHIGRGGGGGGFGSFGGGGFGGGGFGAR